MHLNKTLIIIALIIALPAASAAANYTLQIQETEGAITHPTPGNHTYPANETITLLAGPETTEYIFLEWTGDTETIEDPKATHTTITINGNYTIKPTMLKEGEEPPEEEYEGYILTYPANKQFILRSLDERHVSIRFINNYNQPLQILGISQRTITEGYYLETETPNILEPQEEAKATLIIEPSELQVGHHTHHIDLDYTVNGNPKKATSTMEIEIPRATMSQKGDQLNITHQPVTIPNEWITIQIHGVNNEDAISIDAPKGMQGEGIVQVSHGIWSANFRFTEPGEYHIPFKFYGTYFDSATIHAKNLNQTQFTYTPELQAGKTSNITATLANQELPATITVNGKQATTITPELGETYEVCVTYKDQKGCANETVGKKTMSVAGLNEIEHGDLLQPNLAVTDQETGDHIEYKLVVNNRVPTASGIILDQETNTIEIQAAGYNTVTKTITKPENTTWLPNPKDHLIHIIIIGCIAAIALVAYKGKTAPTNQRHIHAPIRKGGATWSPPQKTPGGAEGVRHES